jgi:hypothetical protein
LGFWGFGVLGFWNKHRPNLNLARQQMISSSQQIDEQLNEITQTTTSLTTLVIPNGYFAARYRDSFAWVQQVNQLEQELASKLIALLSKRKIAQIKIIIPSVEGSWCLSLQSLDLWKFWRKKSWLELMESLQR